MRLQSVLDVVPLDNIVDVCSAHVNSDVNVDEGLFVKAVQAVRTHIHLSSVEQPDRPPGTPAGSRLRWAEGSDARSLPLDPSLREYMFPTPCVLSPLVTAATLLPRDGPPTVEGPAAL
ncbi:unnamed protein product [Gadus morhua 'NCC']